MYESEKEADSYLLCWKCYQVLNKHLYSWYWEAASVVDFCRHPSDRNQPHFPHFYLLGQQHFYRCLIIFSHAKRSFLKPARSEQLVLEMRRYVHLSHHADGGHHCELSLVRGTRRGRGLRGIDFALSLTGVTG